ncbi:hypothetical protein LEMA_P105550.1 [Plenodomus lingam JN3]|uniref:F-box domain-containing protein n=1 Tax=Leptosphaeria maculans (strain JN3 / isolate v23.1.3 / race Av1-4-5-6-7-8) TaxID=985895 RepID=E5A1G0_LEPMJ|nr:hypothetical protein LEMA_P105550.1 [Plenodomus lingam JN3]CBX97424.1 hypothetical protein LEMA_P105550.1 [Plenodomus lingam JN3]
MTTPGPLPNTLLTLLPYELICRICEYLPIDAIIALSATSRSLRYVRSLRVASQAEVPACARWAIRRYFNPPQLPKEHQLCLLCYQVTPLYMFYAHGSRWARWNSSDLSKAQEQNDDAVTADDGIIIPLPRGVCTRHIPTVFVSVVYTGPEGPCGWTSEMGHLCLHCRKTWGTEATGQKKCDCECGHCPVVDARLYTRVMVREFGGGQFEFWREEKAPRELWVHDFAWPERSHRVGRKDGQSSS